MNAYSVFTQKTPTHANREFHPNVQFTTFITANSSSEALDQAKARGIRAPMVEVPWEELQRLDNKEGYGGY